MLQSVLKVNLPGNTKLNSSVWFVPEHVYVPSSLIWTSTIRKYDFFVSSAIVMNTRECRSSGKLVLMLFVSAYIVFPLYGPRHVIVWFCESLHSRVTVEPRIALIVATATDNETKFKNI